MLARLGWIIFEAPEPIALTDIGQPGEFLREHIAGSGCCGARELLKLYAWTLTDYHRVVHLDMDSLVLQNMDELFSLNASCVYTCDYNMMGRRRADGACAVQVRRAERLPSVYRAFGERLAREVLTLEPTRARSAALFTAHLRPPPRTTHRSPPLTTHHPPPPPGRVRGGAAGRGDLRGNDRDRTSG